MADDESLFEAGGTRDYSRVALVVVTLLALVVATTAVPALSPAGTDTPASSLVPIPEEVRGGSGDSGSGGGGGLGALSPGDSTDVGGSLGGESALRSQSDEVHFRVQSTQASYWRTGAYGEYTGAGWERRDGATPVEGELPVEGARDGRVTYEVTLERSAASLPTVWRPTQISRPGVSVTENGAITADGAVPQGTSYTGVSQRPADDPAVLSQAGREYPAAIEDRYTQLPADSEARLGAFTDELTADDDDPYETARTIERWLESNKAYSLNASHDPEREAGVATQFVFDMESGYCEYFATSMVAMLRSQDIPARYVVGYSTGEQVGENSYTVRGMNAHAWTEVYFPDVGWVRFDATPGDERRQQERAALDDEPATATPTPVPTDQPPTDTPTPTDTATPTPTERDDTADGGYDVSLNRTAVPGVPVTVTVAEDGVPVMGAQVLFNGEPVGATATDGNVTATVPYAATLNVTIAGTADERVVVYGAPSRENGRLFRPAGPATHDTETFELNTTAAIAVSGDLATGSEVSVLALVDGEPLRRAAVTLAGEQVATTDDRGRATVRLPEEPGETTLGVRRGAVEGTRTLTLGRLNVSVEPTAPLALPLTDARVNATVAGEPTAGATVALDGERIGTTGVDGTTTVSLPLADSATVAVSQYGQSRRTALEGLYANLAAVVAALLVAVVAAVALARRYGVTPRRIGAALARSGQLVVVALVGIGSLLDRAIRRLYRRTVLTVDHLRALVTGRVSPTALLAALRRWLADRSGGVQSTVTARFESLAPSGDGDAGDDDAHATIREGWSQFLGHVSVARPERRTPEAIAAHAVEVDDLPADAVWTIVDAFRAVEYGQREPTERVPAVDAALAAIDDAVERADDTDGDAPEGKPEVAD